MLALSAGTELGAEVERLVAGQQQPAQHGPERLGQADGADLSRDRLGDRVGLLGGEAAVLDRVRGRVAGGEDVGASVDAAVLVDGDEPVVVVRQPGDARADELGQGHDHVGMDEVAALEPERAARTPRRPRRW